MGFLQTIRDALALPSLAAQPVGYESPWASPNHLASVDTSAARRSDRAVSRSLAMSVPALSRARRLIVGSIARLPMEATRDGARLDVQPRFLSRTDGPVSPFHRMLWTVDDIMFYGWSLWAVERDAEGRVIAADRVPVDQWAFDPHGSVTYDGKPVDDDSVILIPGVDEGIIHTGARSIRHAATLDAAADKAANNPTPHTELHQTAGEPLNRDQIENLVNGWIAARRSPEGAVSYTNSSIEVKTHGSYESHLLTGGRQAAALDIARVTGIPAIMLDAAASDGTMSYSNVDARNTEFIDFCLAPLMSSITARLGMDDVVPRGVAIAFDATVLTGTEFGNDAAPDDTEGGDPDDDTDTTDQEDPQ